MVEFSSASGCSRRQNQQLTCSEISESGQLEMEQLVRDEKVRLLEFYPEDELEGELIYFQHSLLQKAVTKKRLTGVCIILSQTKLNPFFN